MSDINSLALDESANMPEDSVHPSTKILKVKAPRSAFLDILLGFATLTLYSVVWFYLAIRDLRTLTTRHLTPWLWLFVPLIIIAQVFALPLFVSVLKNAEQKLAIKSWSKWQDWLWIIGSLASNIAVVIVNLIDVSLLIQLGSSFLWVVVLFSISGRLSRVRRATENPNSQSFAGYSIIEWLFVIVGVPFTLFVVWFGGLNVYMQGSSLLPRDSVISNKESGYSITAYGDSWRNVNVGTFSDGSGLAEYSGLQNNASIIIFEHENEDLITDTTQWRVEQSIDELSNGKCKESRTLLPNSLNLQVYIECKGKLIGDPMVHLYQYIQIGEKHYIEIYGEYSASNSVFTSNLSTFTKTIRSLVPIEKSDVSNSQEKSNKESGNENE